MMKAERFFGIKRNVFVRAGTAKSRTFCATFSVLMVFKGIIFDTKNAARTAEKDRYVREKKNTPDDLFYFAAFNWWRKVFSRSILFKRINERYAVIFECKLRLFKKLFLFCVGIRLVGVKADNRLRSH